MTRRGMAWGFLSCGFFGAGALFFTQDANLALGTSSVLAGVWCAALALLEYAPTGGTDE